MSTERFGLYSIVVIVATIGGAFVAAVVIGNFASLIWIALAIVTVLLLGRRTDQGGPIEAEPTPDRVCRVLILASGGDVPGDLRDKLSELRPEQGRFEVHIVVPAQVSAVERISSDIDAGHERAEAVLGEIRDVVSSLADGVSGEVGMPEPRIAIEDVLRERGADAVVVLRYDDETEDAFDRAAIERLRRDSPAQLIELGG